MTVEELSHQLHSAEKKLEDVTQKLYNALTRIEKLKKKNEGMLTDGHDQGAVEETSPATFPFDSQASNAYIKIHVLISTKLPIIHRNHITIHLTELFHHRQLTDTHCTRSIIINLPIIILHFNS